MSKDAQFDPEQLQKQIEKLQQSNLDKIKSLASAGKTIDPAALANIKIDTFISTFLDQDAQLVFMHNLEAAFQASLNDALSSVRQETLLQGVAGAKKSLKLP